MQPTPKPNTGPQLPIGKAFDVPSALAIHKFSKSRSSTTVKGLYETIRQYLIFTMKKLPPSIRSTSTFYTLPAKYKNKH